MRKSLVGIAITTSGERIAFVPPYHDGMEINTTKKFNAASVLRNILNKGHIAVRSDDVQVHTSTGVEVMPVITGVNYVRPEQGQTVHLRPKDGGNFETRVNRRKVRARSLHFVFVELPTKKRVRKTL